MILQQDLDLYYNSLTGETITPTRYMQKGTKLYLTTMLDMHNVLSKKEFTLIVSAYDDVKTIDKQNILLLSFKDITSELDPRRRSEMKKKLLDNNILLDYRKKLMFNPFIFAPRNDKNTPNHQFKVQQVWKYLVEDMNKNYDGNQYNNTYTDTEKYIEEMFNS